MGSISKCKTSIISYFEIEPIIKHTITANLGDISYTNNSYALLTSNENDCSKWIVDSGVSDHMTFSSYDFIEIIVPKRTSMENANRVTYPITVVKTIALSPSIS